MPLLFVPALLVLLALALGMVVPAAAQSTPTYWLGRQDGEEYVFDLKLPTEFAQMISTSGKFSNWKSGGVAKLTTEEINGATYNFVTTSITWDLDLIDRGTVAYRGPGAFNMGWWQNLKVDDEFKALIPILKERATVNGTWKGLTLYVLIADDKQPTVRVPVPPMTLAKQAMYDAGQQTTTGIYFSAVQRPVDLAAMRNAMLWYGNLGRQDPNFRKNNGSATALDLSMDRVPTKGKYSPEQVFRQSDTPPFFTDHVLAVELNNAAQFQAEYMASIRNVTHDGPSAWKDPATGKTVNLYDFNVRAPYFGAVNTVEGAGGGALGDYPHGWMKSDTHFRPFFNVDGCYPEIGYGAAKGSDGVWYFVMVPVRDAKCEGKLAPLTAVDPVDAPAATETPVADVTPAAAETPVAYATPAAAETPVAYATPAAAETPVAYATPAAAEIPAADATPAVDSAGERISLQSFNVSDRYIRHSSFKALIQPISSDLDRQDATFVVHVDAADPNKIMLESVNFPNYFLVNDAGVLVLRERVEGDAFTQSATFIKQPGLAEPALIALELAAAPGSYLRHKDFNVLVQADDKTELFKQDATFKIVAPLAAAVTTPAADPIAEALANAPAVVTPSSELVTEPDVKVELPPGSDPIAENPVEVAEPDVVPQAELPYAPATAFPMPAGTAIIQGEKYPSESSNHYLTFQPDGNLVVYDKDDTFVWGINLLTDKFGPATRALVQYDGNLGVYDKDNGYIWSALHVNPDPSAFLTLTPTGSLRLVSGNTAAVLWSSDGPQNAPPGSQQAAAADAPAASPVAKVLGLQPVGVTCKDMPAASDGFVRVRLANVSGSGHAVYFFYKGTRLSPVNPALHFVVPPHATLDIEALEGTQWEMRTYFGEAVGELTATAQEPCKVLPFFRIRYGVADSAATIARWQQVCDAAPKPTSNDVNLRFYNVLKTSSPMTVYKIDMSGAAPVAVEQFTLQPGVPKDVETESDSAWMVRDATGQIRWAHIAAEGAPVCIQLNTGVTGVFN